MENVSEIPDGWIVIKMEPIVGVPYYKLFASWNGAYLSGDQWKMNSGISKVVEDEDHYYIFGFSGSCYKCNRHTYGKLTAYTHGILTNIISNSYKLNVKTDDVSFDDFKKLQFNNQ